MDDDRVTTVFDPSYRGQIENVELYENEDVADDEPTTVDELSNKLLFLGRAAIIGVLTATAVVVFKSSIAVTSAFFYETLADVLPKPAFYWPLVLFPFCGSIIVALLTYFRGESISNGIDYIAKSIDSPSFPAFTSFSSSASGSGYSPANGLTRAIASVATLGSGCSLGPEGPAVELGAGASRIICGPNSTARERHHLFLAGTAAGVSAGFNAPIAGVFFAIECGNRYLAKNTIRLDEEAPDGPRADIAAIVIAAAIADLVVGLGLHEQNALSIQGNTFAMTSPLFELPLYLGLGLVSGSIAVAFSRLRDYFKDLFSGERSMPLGTYFSSVPFHLRPLLGGLLCGVGGLFYPQTLFVGYTTLDQLLAGKIALSFPFLLQLLGLKIVLASFALSSGLIGGIFAPSLFFGAIAGTAYHNVVQEALIALTHFLDQHASTLPTVDAQQFMTSYFRIASAPAYATVGAAATLGALFRAPLTSTILMLELTENHDIVLPVLASSGIAGLFAEVLTQSRRLW